jgi:hypothetical protein
MTSIASRAAALGAVLVALGASPSGAAAQPASGTWQQLVNCAITGYDLTTKHLTCVGSSLWGGTLEGVTTYSVDATYDLLSGDGRGAIAETFYGRSSDGRKGTLRFRETFTVNGSTQAMHIDAHSVGGTQGFARSAATFTFDGFDNLLTGHGTYTGNWRADGVR